MKGILNVLLLACLVGCAEVPSTPSREAVAPRERVVLLPGLDGKSSGAVLISKGGGELLLDQSYAQADAAGEQLTESRSSAEAVQRDYGAVLAMQATRPQTFTVDFRAKSNSLTADTAGILLMVRDAWVKQPASELIVTGYTGNVAGTATNNQLSLVRANFALARANRVVDLLVGLGVAREQFAVVSRDESDLSVPMDDDAVEARNRRVDIKLR